MGAAYEMDTDYYVPMANYLLAKSDSTLEIGIMGNDEPRHYQWSMDKGKLWLDTNRYLSSQYALNPELFTLKNPYESYYFKVESYDLGQAIDENYFQNKSFASVYDTLEFSATDSLLIKKGANTDKAYFSLWQKEGAVFLIKKGSAFESNGNFRFIEQIVAINDDQFTVKRWQVDAMKMVTYKKTATAQLKADSFQLCNAYLYRNNPKHRYYYHDVFYKGGHYKINKRFHSYFSPQDYKNINGICQLEFIVNCQGQAGRFSLKQFDLDFALTEFPEAFQNKMLEFGQSLQDWNSGKSQAGENIDTYRFLNFKFKNGELLEIFP